MNKEEKLSQIVHEIVASNKYLVLGTTDGVLPWVAPLYYCADDRKNLYFISRQDSRHMRHIREHSHVAFSIFDSTQPEGTGNGVQGSGVVEQVVLRDIPEALRWYRTKFFPYNSRTFANALNYRLFKLTPKHLYVLDPSAAFDKRVEVGL